MYQGDSRGYRFTFYTDEAQTTEWDFSAATEVIFTVKKTLDSSSALFSVTATNSINGNDWANGVAVFRPTSVQTALLDRNGKYDVQITLAGNKITPVYGDIVLQRQITL